MYCSHTTTTVVVVVVVVRSVRFSGTGAGTGMRWNLPATLRRVIACQRAPEDIAEARADVMWCTRKIYYDQY